MNNISTKIIMAVLAVSISAGAPICNGEVRIGDTPARRIAKEPMVRGKYVDGQCLPFARDLRARFRAAGIRSKIITFNYQTLCPPRALFGDHRNVLPINERGSITGAHAVVAYEDQGRTYVMDNQSWQPRWIHNDSPIGIAQQFSGMHVLVAKARVVDNSRPSRALTAKMRATHLFHVHTPNLRLEFAAR